MLAAAVALVGSLIAGVIAHELAHAAALRALGIPCAVEWLPGDGTGDVLGLNGWAAVTPQTDPDRDAPWKLRLAAVMPLALALPFVPVLVGVAPDPLASGSLPANLAVIGWLACAIPSPADFSTFWYPRRSLEAER